ncbi:MAG: branched-chain amino acid transport system permease protein [Gammaproteobacteria bacterium]
MIDLLLSPQLLFSALVLGSTYALVALGLNLVYGTMRLLNIAHGDLIMVGAYGAFWFFTLSGLSPVIGLPLIALICAALGLTLYYCIFRHQLENVRPIERVEANSLLLFFAISVIVQNVASLAFSGSPRAYRHLDTVYHVVGVSMTGDRIVVLLVAVILLCGVVLFLNRSHYGLSISALIQNQTAAKIVGINVSRIQLLSFTIGFALAGVAGALISMTEQISPFMGFPFTIVAFVVIILGGLGNIKGGIAAGLLLGFVEIYVVVLTSANFRSILIYGLFVGVLLLRPQGLFGKTRAA